MTVYGKVMSIESNVYWKGNFYTQGSVERTFTSQSPTGASNFTWSPVKGSGVTDQKQISQLPADRTRGGADDNGKHTHKRFVEKVRKTCWTKCIFLAVYNPRVSIFLISSK